MAEITVAKVLARNQKSWDALHAYIATLDQKQLTTLVDGGGWTIKDHLMHLSLWEDHLTRILNGEDLVAGFDVTPETFKTGSDAINAVLKPRYEDMSLTEVKAALNASHERMTARIATMSDADLMLPYRHYQPVSKRNQPVEGWIAGNSSGHYNQHLRWIKTLAEG